MSSSPPPLISPENFIKGTKECVRYLKENPFTSLDEISEALNIPPKKVIKILRQTNPLTQQSYETAFKSKGVNPKAVSRYNNCVEFLEAYSDELSSIKLLESLRWADKMLCPCCGMGRFFDRKKPGDRACYKTKKIFNVRTGTMLENTKIPLQMWLMVLSVFCGIDKGRIYPKVSGYVLAASLGVTQKTAFNIYQRIDMINRISDSIFHRNIIQWLSQK
jgi:hypothetical protein